MAYPSPEIDALIVQIALEEMVDPALALAMATQESGRNPFAIGDAGHSVGLFQLNDAGLGYGLSVTQRQAPELNARIALRHLAETMQVRPDLLADPGALAAASQRPFDPAGYARSVNGLLGGSVFVDRLPGPDSGSDEGSGLPVPSLTDTRLAWLVLGGAGLLLLLAALGTE